MATVEYDPATGEYRIDGVWYDSLDDYEEAAMTAAEEKWEYERDDQES